MTPLRLAVVTRRFWPLADEPETGLANLVSRFPACGVQPTVITAQWRADWPTRALFREIPVVRVPQSSQGGWGTWRYMRRLAKWLGEHREEFDAVLVSRLRYDAYAALGALRDTTIPVVVRAEGAGELGDAAWLVESPFGSRLRTRLFSAEAIIAGSRAVADELLAAGCPAERLRVVAAGVELLAAAGLKRADEAASIRAAARQALATACGDLATNPEDPVFLFIGRLHRANNPGTLVRAWSRVATRLPRASLWLVGDGPEREPLYRRIVEAGLRQQTFLPGSFDDWEDLLHAADVLLAPARAADRSPLLLQALAAGLPIIASDTAGHRELLAEQDAGILVLDRDHQSWSEAMRRLAEADAERRRRSAAAMSLAAEFPLARTTDAYLEILNASRESRTHVNVRRIESP